MSVRQDLDAVIDWYEQHDSAAGRVIAVAATAATVRKFARKQGKRGGPYMYRGREVVPVRLSRKDCAPPVQVSVPLTNTAGCES